MLLIALLSMSFFGCNAISSVFDSVFLSTPDVKAVELDDYDETAGAVSSEATLEEGLELAFSAMGNAAPSRTILGDDYEAIVDVLKIAAPDVARVIAPEAPASRKATASASASITNEELTDGNMTIVIDEIQFSGEAELDDIDEPTNATAKFDAKIELGISDIEDQYWDDVNLVYVPYSVDDFRLNVNGNGNGTAAFGMGGYEDIESVEYYTGLAVSVGFSLTSPGCSGKYLATFKYVNSATITGGDTEPDFTGEESLEITVSVYDNKGIPLEEKTYTETEIISLTASV